MLDDRWHCSRWRNAIEALDHPSQLSNLCTFIVFVGREQLANDELITITLVQFASKIGEGTSVSRSVHELLEQLVDSQAMIFVAREHRFDHTGCRYAVAQLASEIGQRGWIDLPAEGVVKQGIQKAVHVPPGSYLPVLRRA